MKRRVHMTEILERVAQLIDEGRLRVFVGAAYPLDAIAEAHAALESGAVTGKIVLQVPGRSGELVRHLFVFEPEVVAELVNDRLADFPYGLSSRSCDAVDRPAEYRDFVGH